MTKIYVGNLPFTATEPDVRELFAQHGTVESVALPTDRETGRPRGFGFVEYLLADCFFGQQFRLAIEGRFCEVALRHC